ncbi:ANK-REP-region domain-containing protein [Favolaschia claudopus]|uniref:ANK-REP-region domain-containing protein n=1 Tax=Favolaschia claudopus TaxID=2862362 RepID=A0AAV9ZBR4_9AGAR
MNGSIIFFTSVYGGFGGPGGLGGQHGGSGGVGIGAHVAIHDSIVHLNKGGQSDDQKQKILGWLSPFNFFQRQNDIFETCQEGTGQWFLSSQNFKTWLSSPQKVLWCEGIQGSGKTALSSLVIDYIQNTYITSPSTGFAWLYLDYKEDQVQTKANLFANICHQLWVCKPIPVLLQNLYTKHLARKTRPTLNEIVNVLQITLLEHSRMYLVIDALDEFSDPERAGFLLKLAKIIKQFPVHLLITVRPHSVSHNYFPHIQRIEIEAHQEDITLYVEDQLQILPNVVSLIKVRPSLLQEIIQAVGKDVNGMFLLAKLRMASLAAQTNITSLLAAITELPRDLTIAYLITMDRINSQSETYKELAHRTLMWVSNAIRPLSVTELCQILAVEPGDTSLDLVKAPHIEIILAVCAGLVTIDKEVSVVRLVHFTAQDWLGSWFPNAHKKIALTCFQYLGFSDISDWRSFDGKKYPLAIYSQHCIEHTQKTGNCEIELIDQVKQFASKAYSWRKLWKTLWWSTFWGLGPWPKEQHDFQTLVLAAAGNLQSITYHLLTEEQFDTRHYKCALSLAAYRGHCEIVQLLLSLESVNSEWGLHSAIAGKRPGIVAILLNVGVDLSIIDGCYGSALQRAARGSEPIVKLLLDAGADVNIVGGSYGTALYVAACSGSERIVKMLLDAGADPNNLNVGVMYNTALFAAVESDSEYVVKMLLDAGADANIVSEPYGTALHVAVCNISEHIVKMLLDAGADANTVIDYLGTALHVAASSDKSTEPIMKMLLSARADPNIVGGMYDTALIAAVEMDSEPRVKMLIDAGADVNIVEDCHYGTALHTAAKNSSEPIVKMLLEAGANTNIVGGMYGTALQAAANDSSEAIVKMLLDSGADPNIIGAMYVTALLAAVERNCEPIVKTLLDAGADPNIVEDSHYGSALQTAAKNSSEPIVKMLLDAGAHTNIVGGYFKTALHAAAYKSSEPIVNILLDAGAYTNIVGGVYDTALLAAVERDSEPIVKILLDARADVNIVGGRYGTALQAAIACIRNEPSSESIVKLLLDAGADPNVKGSIYKSALQSATAQGLQTIERMLLEAGAIPTDYD